MNMERSRHDGWESQRLCSGIRVCESVEKGNVADVLEGENKLQRGFKYVDVVIMHVITVCVYGIIRCDPGRVPSDYSMCVENCGQWTPH